MVNCEINGFDDNGMISPRITYHKNIIGPKKQVIGTVRDPKWEGEDII